jgi:guanine deaminase
MPDMSAEDRKHLLHAVDLSRARMLANLGGPFGAVIVRDGEIIAEGWNEVTSSNDPTAHGEVTAIRRACEKLGTFSLKGATIYSSCEPCPMCLSAIYWARLDRLVFANTRQQAAAIGFDDEFLYQEVPKPIAERSIPTEHLALSEADEVFDMWMKKADKIEY